MDWEGGKLRFLLGPPPGFRYCSDMLLCGLLDTKEGGWGGSGGVGVLGGWWVIGHTMALSRFPSFFHSDNEPRPQRLWLRSTPVT